MVTHSKDGWDKEVVYCGYSNDERQSHASVVSASSGPHCRNNSRPKLVWVSEGTKLRRRHGAMCNGALEWHQTTMDTRRRHQILLRSCMLMPPSRTRETCLRSNIAPLLAGENVQHIDMLCMRHTIRPYALNSRAYIIYLVYVN